MNKEDLFIINVGRQLGSGGHIIGRQLAKDFNIRFYDKELLDLAAQESGFNKKFFERNDEHKGFFKLLLSSFAPIFSNSENIYNNQLSDESLFKFQSDAIRKAASQESCVFVGRCADYILRDNPRCVNIFITGDMEDRIQRVSERLNISPAEAEKKILSGDENRASYDTYYSAKTWGQADSYHLCINSSILGLEDTTEFIKEFIKKKLNL